MEPVAEGHSVKAFCSECGVLSLFNFRDATREYGHFAIDRFHEYLGVKYGRIHYKLLRCVGCGKGAIAKFHDGVSPTILESFHPRSLYAAKIPPGVPDGIIKEYREAELCASVEAWRAASALLRSTLEKLLKANGYIKGSLESKIDEAADNGVITAARKQRAHEDIRVLGNEVVHDEWRPVDGEEVQQSLHYVQRIIEDLYDDRATVEKILKAKGKI